MARTIINGTLQPVRTQTRTQFDPQKGFTVTAEFESAGDNLNGLALQCLLNRIQYEHTPNPVRSKLVYSASGPQAGYSEVPVDTWQLLANELSVDVKEAPAVRAMEASFPGSIAEVLKAVQDYNDDQLSLSEIEDWSTTTGPEGKLWRLLIHGVTSYPIGQYVLKHTTNVSNVYATNVADDGVEFVYTTTQLIQEITNSGFWLFPCPGRLVNKIQNIEVQQPSNGDIMWGWRKLPSQETTAAGNRIDISTEYWLAGWSTLLYSPK